MTPKKLTPLEVRVAMKALDARGLLKPIYEVCRAYNVTIESVLRKDRSRRVVMARDACCMKCVGIGLSSTEVGGLLCMDHTSVLLAVRRYRERDNGRALT